MSARLDVNYVAIVNYRLYISIRCRDLCEGYQHIQRGNGCGSRLQARDVRLYGCSYLSEFFVFKFVDPGLGCEDKVFFLLKLRSYISFVVYKSLLADVVIRHLVYHALADIYVISEDFVISDP